MRSKDFTVNELSLDIDLGKGIKSFLFISRSGGSGIHQCEMEDVWNQNQDRGALVRWVT